MVIQGTRHVREISCHVRCILYHDKRFDMSSLLLFFFLSEEFCIECDVVGGVISFKEACVSFFASETFFTFSEPYYTNARQFSCQCKRGPCSLPVDSGPCDGLFIKYYYNTHSNSCGSFNYGDCQGNANKFDTIRECKRRCMG
ncbi:Mambaquaretin-1 [Bulinus truncatus]|nr:Mambaquaretin-1 [Bulinus truncatus]